jgi:hypothetical protein
MEAQQEAQKVERARAGQHEPFHMEHPTAKRGRFHMYSLAGPKSLVTPTPVAVYAYIDKIGCWLRDPLCQRDLAGLRCHCDWLWAEERVAGFNPDLRQHLQLYQPRPPALAWLARRNDLHFNYLENSLDWIFRTEDENDYAGDFLDHHFVKNRHRLQGIRYAGATRYTGPRRARNQLVVYTDRECKLTGETLCTHLDWRIRGSAAIRQAGLSMRDLITLDQHEFWRPRLLLFGVDDLSRLGRKHNNHFWGTKRRRDWIEFYGSLYWNHDARLGRIVFTICDGKVQKLVDRFAFVRSSLIRLPVDDLLPNAGF